MADLTNGIDNSNVGPPVGPPFLQEFLVSRPYQENNDWRPSAIKGQVSFGPVSVSGQQASISSMTLALPNVVSGQPIIIAVMGEPININASPTPLDNFATSYTYTQIGSKQFAGGSGGGGGNAAFLQLWIATGGSGNHGTITISGLTNGASYTWGAMAYPAINASTASGLYAVDTFALNSGQGGVPSAPAVAGSYNGGGAVGFIFAEGDFAVANVGNPTSPVGWNNDALPGYNPYQCGASGGVVSNTQYNQPINFAWSSAGNYWCTGAVILLPSGYSNTSVGVEAYVNTIPSEMLPPIGPPAITAFLFAPPLPTEMGPSAPAHVPNTQASVTPALAGPPIGEMFPPLGPPPINAFLFGRDTSTGDSGFSPNTWIGVASVTSGNLNISATSQRTAFANSSVTFGNLNVSATSQKTVSGNASVPISSLSVTATSQVTVVSVSSVAIGNLSVVAASRHTVTGSAAVTAGNLTITAHGFKTATGSSSVTLGSLTASAIGARAATGFSSISIGTLSITATGTTFRTHPGRILSSIIPKGSITTSVEMKGSITARVVPKGTITTSVEL